MDTERTMIAGAVVVAVVALIGALALPGAVAEPGDEFRQPGRVAVAELSIRPGQVSGGSAELAVTAQLDHRGNPAPNVSVRLRAVDAESGFVAAERTIDVGTLDDDGWHPVNATLQVDREGGYVIELVAFQDGDPIDRTRKRVSGLEALTPAYAQTAVGFTDRGTVPSVAVSVETAGDAQTTLRVEPSLTNAGDSPSDDLRVVVIARQADSNLEAARVEATVGSIRPGRTDSVATTITVPSGYNYYLDVLLFKDGVLIETTQTVANLAPNERIAANETGETVTFNVSDFERDRQRERDRPTSTETSSPGMGIVLALAALIAIALIARRRR